MIAELWHQITDLRNQVQAQQEQLTRYSTADLDKLKLLSAVGPPPLEGIVVGRVSPHISPYTAADAVALGGADPAALLLRHGLSPANNSPAHITALRHYTTGVVERCVQEFAVQYEAQHILRSTAAPPHIALEQRIAALEAQLGLPGPRATPPSAPATSSPRPIEKSGTTVPLTHDRELAQSPRQIVIPSKPIPVPLNTLATSSVTLPPRIRSASFESTTSATSGTSHVSGTSNTSRNSGRSGTSNNSRHSGRSGTSGSSVSLSSGHSGSSAGNGSCAHRAVNAKSSPRTAADILYNFM